MKKFLATAAMAAAMAIPGVAHADNVAYSGTFGLGPLNVNTGNPIVYGLGVLASGVGYEQYGFNAGNIQAATPTVTNTWLITGNVTRDCSYYAGGGASTGTSHTLDFGTIGVNTQSNTSVNNAFDMVSAATATVNSTTAGCNFNNTVKVSKANGAQGLLNNAAGGYDSNEFQANIPYSATASFNGTTNQAGPQAGGPQSVAATTGIGSATGNFGAWRSAMTLNINAPVPPKALVAGTYQDTLTVELKAL